MTEKVLELINKLRAIIETDFENNLPEANKKILKSCEEVIELIHGRRSFNCFNYRLLPIESELTAKKYDLRICILRQVLKRAESHFYDKKELSEIWNEFLFSKKMDYGSGPNGWSNDGLPGKINTLLVPLILNKLKSKLLEKLTMGERDLTLKMLRGVRARFNVSYKEYHDADIILRLFDPKGIYEHQWV